ncbi:MAG: peptidase U32 family protein [[Eubacterium] siraeum]
MNTLTQRGARVYLTCNTVPSNDEIELLPEFIKTAYDCGIDAAIVSDIGCIALIKRTVPELEIDVSYTGGSSKLCNCKRAVQDGVQRVVLAREVDIENIKRIRDNIPEDMDIEVFVHGAMCVSFSGRCLLSAFMTGRNANKGECAQPCRWKYHLVEEKRTGRLLWSCLRAMAALISLTLRICVMIEHLKELKDAGVTSFKIEGRAKSAYYTATVTNAYRAALDAVKNGEPVPKWAVDEVYR